MWDLLPVQHIYIYIDIVQGTANAMSHPNNIQLYSDKASEQRPYKLYNNLFHFILAKRRCDDGENKRRRTFSDNRRDETANR